MIGIYKITAPDKKIYIGQSKDIFNRWKSYEKLRCKSQPKIYNSLLKYGVEKHVFEIITECEVDELIDLERYYQDLFNCINEQAGLNSSKRVTKKERSQSGVTELNRSIRLSDEHYEMAVKDAKDIGLNLTSYIRYLLIKANKEKKQSK